MRQDPGDTRAGAGPRGEARRGPSTDRDAPAAEAVTGWFVGRLPDEWFVAEPEVTVDRDEIVVVGELAPPELPDGASDAERRAATAGRIARFREDTRDRRMRLADEAERRFGRRTAWGATIDGTRQLFTTMSVPVMTRLRQPERVVLDTLVEAGVARSRSDALAWCVRLTGQHAASWLDELRDSLQAVQRLREQDPVGRPRDQEA